MTEISDNILSSKKAERKKVILSAITAMVILFLFTPSGELITRTSLVYEGKRIFTPDIPNLPFNFRILFNIVKWYFIPYLFAGLVVGTCIHNKRLMYTILTLSICIACCLSVALDKWNFFNVAKSPEVNVYMYFGWSQCVLLILALTGAVLGGNLGNLIATQTFLEKIVLGIAIGLIATNICVNLVGGLMGVITIFTSTFIFLTVEKVLTYLISGFFVGFITGRKGWIFGGLLGLIVALNIMGPTSHIKYTGLLIYNNVLQVIGGMLGGFLGQLVASKRKFDSYGVKI